MSANCINDAQKWPSQDESNIRRPVLQTGALPLSYMRVLTYTGYVWCNQSMAERKRCTRCYKPKRMSNFSWRKTGVRRQSWCKQCSTEVRMAHYWRNPTKHRRSCEEREKRVRAEVFGILAERGCSDCREKDPLVLDFDHVRGRKFKNVSYMVMSGFALKRVLTEIAKCDVRCANCHRRRTARQFKWRKMVAVEGLEPSAPSL